MLGPCFRGSHKKGESACKAVGYPKWLSHLPDRCRKAVRARCRTWKGKGRKRWQWRSPSHSTRHVAICPPVKVPLRSVTSLCSCDERSFSPGIHLRLWGIHWRINVKSARNFLLQSLERVTFCVELYARHDHDDGKLRRLKYFYPY